MDKTKRLKGITN